MPHKHKRKRGNDDNDHDLPPTQQAQSLPVSSSKGSIQPQGSKRQKKGKSKDGDAPRAFRKLMAFTQGVKTRSGLDDGKPAKPAATDAANELRIRPGEDMGTFSARVNAAMPLSGLTKKSVIKDGKDEQGIKVVRTRKEKKMHKLYDQWRAEEVKIQDKRDEEAEEEAERELDNEVSGMTSIQAELNQMSQGKKKKGRGKADDDDPWAELKKKRAEAKIGLHDVALAPPQLHKKTTRQLKMTGDVGVDVSNIPKAAGSLRRREELQSVREDVLEAYRKIREHEQAKLDGPK